MSRLREVENPLGTAGALNLPVRICAPGNVKGWRNTPTSAVLNWDELYSACTLCPDATGYEVAVEGCAAQSVVRPPCHVTGLTPDTEYNVYVTAIAAGNNISNPTVYRLREFMPVAPSQPGPLLTSDVTPWSATLKWSPSTDNGGNIRYRVYLNDNLAGQVDQLVFNLSHLRSSVSYRLKVVAVNEGGTSEPVCASFKTLLRPPTNIKLKHNAGTCRLSWAPMFLRLPTHQVTVNGKSFTAGPLGFNFSLAEVSPGPAPHHLNVEVYAKLDEQVSETTKFETTLNDVEPPSTPGQPTVSNITNGSADLEWTPSHDNTGVSHYRVNCNGVLKVESTSASYTLPGLNSGINNLVYVRAEDKAGNVSAISMPTQFVTTGPVSTPPSTLYGSSITALTSTSVRVQWDFRPFVPTTGAVTLVDGLHYETKYAGNFAEVQNLIPGFTYSIDVFPLTIGWLFGPLSYEFECRDIAPPSVPGNLSVQSLTKDSVAMAWDASTDDVGVLEYVIYNNSVYFDRTELTQYTAVDLVPDTYSFEICAIDTSGNASEPASISVEIQGTLWSNPTNLRISRAVTTSLRWDAPADMLDVIRYDIVLSGSGKDSLSFQTTRNFFSPDQLASNLYRVSITALNAEGRSAPLIGEFTT